MTFAVKPGPSRAARGHRRAIGALAWLFSTDALSVGPLLEIPLSGVSLAMLVCILVSLLGQALRWGLEGGSSS